MIATDVTPTVRTWAWDNQIAPYSGLNDVLVIGFGFAHFVAIGAGGLPALLEVLGCARTHEDVLAAFRKPAKLRPATLSLQDLQAVEHGTLLTEEVVRLRYRVGDKAKTLKLRLPSKSKLFDELRVLLSPQSQVRQVEMPLGLAIRGPILGGILGGMWWAICAGGSMSQELAWQEKYSGFYALLGTILRKVGPWGWSAIGIIWVIGAALLLRERIKKRPSMEVWEVGPGEPGPQD